MTIEEAKENQARIAKHYNLGWWYGTNCKKCCEVFPKFKKTETTHDQCYYQCEVCGKRTKAYEMPWQAVEAWNRNEFENSTVQLRLF